MLVIASRGSQLALWQARWVERQLATAGLESRIEIIKTTGDKITDLPHAAKVGTSSLRRAAQLRKLRPDLAIESVRGNLDTRLRKLDEGRYDAIVLAAAGLKRLGCADRIAGVL